MAVAYVWNCGSECGLTTGNASGAAEHYDIVVIGAGGAVTSDTTIFRASGGSRSLKVVAANNITYAQSSGSAATAVGMNRVFVRIESAPTATSSILAITTATGTVANIAQIRYNTTGPKLEAFVTTGSAAGSFTPVVGRWYLIEMKYNVSATTYTLDWSVDGVAQTQASSAAGQTIGTAGKSRFGIGTGSSSATIYYDDMVHATCASGDAFIGDGRVVGYLPTSNGTHSFTSGDFQNAASSNLGTSETTTWNTLDEIPFVNTDFVKQVVIRSAGYVEYKYGTGSEPTVPRGVEQVVAFHNLSTTADTHKAQLYDGTTSTDTFGLISAGSVAGTITARTKQWTASPSGAWTRALFDLLKLRWGFSTNVTTNPALDGSIIEAEFAPLPAPAELRTIRQALDRSVL